MDDSWPMQVPPASRGLYGPAGFPRPADGTPGPASRRRARIPGRPGRPPWSRQL